MLETPRNPGCQEAHTHFTETTCIYHGNRKSVDTMHVLVGE